MYIARAVSKPLASTLKNLRRELIETYHDAKSASHPSNTASPPQHSYSSPASKPVPRPPHRTGDLRRARCDTSCVPCSPATPYRRRPCWTGVEEVPLLGPEDLSYNDMAEIM